MMRKWLMTFKIITQFIIKPSTSYLDAVEKVCRLELKRDSNNFYALWFLSNAYVQNGKFNEAIIILEKLLNSGRGGDKVILNLSRAYFNLKEYHKVYQVLSKLELLPEKETANYYLGYSLIELGKTDDGINYLKIYLHNHPKDCLVFCKLGYEYYKQKRYNLALEAYKKAKRLDPSNKAIQDSIDLCVKIGTGPHLEL